MKWVPKLITWDVLTGKLVDEYELTGEQAKYTEYERFKTEYGSDMYATGHYERTLLVSKKSVDITTGEMARFYSKEILTKRFDH